MKVGMLYWLIGKKVKYFNINQSQHFLKVYHQWKFGRKFYLKRSTTLKPHTIKEKWKKNATLKPHKLFSGKRDTFFSHKALT